MSKRTAEKMCKVYKLGNYLKTCARSEKKIPCLSCFHDYLTLL